MKLFGLTKVQTDAAAHEGRDAGAEPPVSSESANGNFDRLRHRLGGIPAFALISAMTLTMAVGFLLRRLTPDYATLYLGLDGRSAQALARKLSARGVAYELEPDGRTVSVPADKLDAVRAELAEEGVFPATSLAGELEDKLRTSLIPLAGRRGLRVSVFVETSPVASERTRESYDPKAAVVVTSQDLEQRDASPAQTPAAAAAAQRPSQLSEASSSRNTTRNYVVSKTVERVSHPAGAVKRIATAILIDDLVSTDRAAAVRRKRSPLEMEQIEILARAAVGFDEARGDRLTVQNISFEEPHASSLPQTRIPGQYDLALYGALFLASLLACLLLLRRCWNPVCSAPIANGCGPEEQRGASLAPATKPTLPVPAPGAFPTLPDGIALKKLLVERIQSEPAVASHLIQSWIRQDEAGR